MVFGEPDIQAYEENNITNGEWHHVAVAVDINIAGDETVILYIDGIEVKYGCCADFNSSINNANGDFYAKLGYATGDFKNIIGTTAQSPLSNWVNGVNFPSAVYGRAFNAYWTDEFGDFFIFAGQGENGIYNSIRKFDKGLQEWVTIKGSDVPNDLGNYGEKGVSDVANMPPARWAVSAATDINDDIWIFGGTANDLATQWFNDFWRFNVATSEWTWISGESTANQLPIYGTKGISDPGNMPSPRDNHKTWSDAQGNIWIFGGYGLDAQGEIGYLDDLWKFNVTSSEWTWVTGNDAANQAGVFGTIDEYNTTNHPGARSASIQWVDTNGIVWLFGGQGIDKFGISPGYLNDLWSYDPSINQWSWHSGSDFAGSTGSYNETGLSSVDYVPGSRWHSTGWIDESDNLWLFGGYKFNQLSTGLYNDFWKYTPTTKEWTWLNGFSSTANINQVGVYGDVNEASSTHPGSRHGGLTWTDFEGNFWMLGGAELGSSTYGFYNDLWKYEPQKNKWQYLLGDTKLSLNDGVYGSKGIGSATNDPKSRWHGSSWTGQDGKLWFFGGINHNEDIGNVAWLNDLWYFDPESNVYTWVGGSSTINTPGVYGVKAEASTGHIPGARSSSAYWSDEDGNFWLFGGYESFEYNNDLWRFNPGTLEWTWMSGNNFQNAPGIYGQKGVTGPTNSIGARRYTDGKIDQDGNVWVFGGDGHDKQAQRGFLGDLWKYEPSSNSWTWMAGSEFRNTLGNFGELGVPSPDNVPPPRYSHTSWIDDSGNLWIFGGLGLLSEGGEQVSGQLNDLWKFDTKTNMWTWLGGSDTFISTGEYGVQGEFSEKNALFGRARSQAFGVYDKSLWLFGGRTSSSVSYNDFWEIKFNPGLAYIEAPSDTQQTGFTFSYDEPWAREYQIQVAVADDFSDTFFDETTSNTQITIGNLQPGTYYNYRVNAINEIGQSDFSPDSKYTVLTNPASPIFNLQSALSSITQGEAVFNWEAPQGFYENYLLEVSTDLSFANPNLMLDGYGLNGLPKEIAQTEVAHTVSGLLSGQTYFARIRAVNSSGESPNSNILDFTTVPSAPVNITTNNITQQSAEIRWPSTNGSEVYVIDLNTSESFVENTSIVTESLFDKDVFHIRDLKSGIRYYARVQGSNESGRSGNMTPPDYGNTTFITIPSSPILNIISDYTQESFMVSWPDVVGASEYVVDASDNFFQTFLPGFNQKQVTNNRVTISGMTPGDSYQVRVKSQNESGFSENSVLFDLEALPATPISRDPSSISTRVFTAHWDPAIGAGFYVLEVSQDDFQTFHFNEQVPTSIPVQITGLTAGATYMYRIKAGNNSGTSPYSNVITVIAQNNAQSLNISNVGFDPDFQDGTNSTTVTATLSGGQIDPEVLIRYKGILSSNWSELIDMNGSGATFTFDFTDSMLDEVGIEFEIFANDNITFVESLGNKIKRAFNESQSSELPSLVFNEWQMIAIPFELENNQVTAVFNELTSLEYKKQWRLMHYQEGAYLDAITGFANIEIGLGYWLNIISEASINVGAGKANAEIPFKITLKQGWNQIGNPFNTSVNWNQVRSDNGAISRVDNPFIYDINQKTFISSTILQSFEGAYVWADEEIQLDVTPASSNGRIANVANHLATVENGNWQLPIIFKSNEKAFQIAGVGMNKGASNLKDSFDRLAPPKFENYTEMVTTRSEAIYPYFHTDITSLKADQIWNFTLSSNQLIGEVALEWDNLKLNKYFGLWVVNEKTGKVIDMKSNGQHSFYLKGETDFSIHYSEDPNYAVLPKLLSLGEPFPNPATNQTNIPLMLPNRDQSYQIDLSIFDLNGRKVKTIANGEYQNGFHLIGWNPGEEIKIKSGIYFYRLSFQNETIMPVTKKLIIKK